MLITSDLTLDMVQIITQDVSCQCLCCPKVLASCVQWVGETTPEVGVGYICRVHETRSRGPRGLIF